MHPGGRSYKSPADAVVPSITALPVNDSYEIDKKLPLPQALGNSFEIRIFITDHDSLCMNQHFVHVIDHELRYVWNVVQDKVSVRAHQTGDIHVPVIDAQIVTFSQQSFDDLNHRTFSQIVCSSLETESQNAHSLVALFRDELQTSRDLHFVAGQNRSENRQIQIVHLRLVRQRPKIFWQTRPSERKTG